MKPTTQKPALTLTLLEAQTDNDSETPLAIEEPPVVCNVRCDYPRRRVIVQTPFGEWELTAVQAKDLGLTLRAKAFYIEETVRRETTFTEKGTRP